MSRLIVSVHSGKGGVGKTSLVANLGAALAKAGYTTLLVDMDFGTRGLTNFFIFQGIASQEPSANVWDLISPEFAEFSPLPLAEFDSTPLLDQNTVSLREHLYLLPAVAL